MKKLVLVISAVLPLFTNAQAIPNNAAFNPSSSAEYNSPMNNANTMSNVQVNNSATPFVDLRGIRCPVASLTTGAGVGAAHTKDNGSQSANAVIGFQVPIDLNGTIDRCQQAQRAEVAKMRFASDMEILRACVEARTNGYRLDPAVYPWAAKCNGLITVQQPYNNDPALIQKLHAMEEFTKNLTAK